MRIHGTKFAIAENVAQIKEIEWQDHMGVPPSIANRRKTYARRQPWHYHDDRPVSVAPDKTDGAIGKRASKI